jgi:hypothetical protein
MYVNSYLVMLILWSLPVAFALAAVGHMLAGALGLVVAGAVPFVFILKLLASKNKS